MNNWKGMKQESVNAGINLLGTEHAGKSAAQLRRDDPALADKWAAFITANKSPIADDIAGRIWAREMADYNRATKAMGLVGR